MRSLLSGLRVSVFNASAEAQKVAYVYFISPTQVLVPHPNRLSLSIAGTVALALASMPLAVSPAGATAFKRYPAQLTEVTNANISAIQFSSNPTSFNSEPQVALNGLAATSSLPVVAAIPVPNFVKPWLIFLSTCFDRGFSLRTCLGI